MVSGSSPYPANWYYLLYVLDFLFSASAITILFKVYKYGLIAPFEFIYYFFPSFLLLFNVTSGVHIHWSNAQYVSYIAVLLFFP